MAQFVVNVHAVKEVVRNMPAYDSLVATLPEQLQSLHAHLQAAAVKHDTT